MREPFKERIGRGGRGMEREMGEVEMAGQEL